MQLPFTIAEDNGWFVVCDQILELRKHVLANITRLVVEPKGVVPLVKRVVITHPQAFATHSLGEVAKQIALRTDLHRVPRAPPRCRCLFAGPERETLMMLRGQHDVLRP